MILLGHMNSHNAPQMSFGQSLFGSVQLDELHSRAIKKTYLLLSLAVFAGIGGGFVGSNSPALIQFFSGWVGWIVAMVALNAIPYIAMACRNNPFLGTLAITADGFIAGLILAPILYIANHVAPNVVPMAGLLTLVIFMGVTASVMFIGKVYSAPRALMIGLFVSVIGVVVLNMFITSSILTLVISLAIGIIGVLVLVQATSQVLNNPEFNEPVMGAVMLFSGLFNIFVALLHILLAFGGFGED
jgi:FtsH-binding integral membrane protein